MSSKIDICDRKFPGQEYVLTSSALRFLAGLHQKFDHRRKILLRHRRMQQKRFNSGELPKFSDKVGSSRHFPWNVTSTPEDLKDRRVELLGSVDIKTMVQGLNSDASVFVADFEDVTSPTWENCIRGQINLRDAVNGNLWYMKKEGGTEKIQERKTAIEVRPRGLHQDEKHLLINGEPISASLFDFGLYLYNNAYSLVQDGSGPYFSLPKLENRQEAKWWNDVFKYAKNKLTHLPPQTIKVTVSIETLPAVFEVEEITYELREYLVGLKAGEWNYLFSLIKNFRKYERYILPSRDQNIMNLPFMQAYNRLLVKIANRRGVQAIGGVTVAVPDNNEQEGEMVEVRRATAREAKLGFDGTQIVHPDSVPIVREEFTNALEGGGQKNDRAEDDRTISRLELLHTFMLDTGKITEKSLRQNIDVLMLYIASWLKGKGVVKLENRLENNATAEICRAQMWQWSHQSNIKLEDGRAITKRLYQKFLKEEKQRITRQNKNEIDSENFEQASKLLANLVWEDEFESYMSLPAYNMLE